MNIVGMIAEYNPFHAGHRHHIEETVKRAEGAAVVAVMSGYFVQRGEPALLSKWVRARKAVECGADLVVELPAYYATAAAPDFAFGGVAMLRLIGATHISFGSEIGDLSVLREMSYRSADEVYRRSLRESLSSGMSYAQASIRAGGIPFPNAMLAAEYLRNAPDLIPILIPRADNHSDASLFGELPAIEEEASRTGVAAEETEFLTERKNFKDSENKENSCAAKAGVSEYGGASERTVLSRQSGARTGCETEGERNQSADEGNRMPCENSGGFLTQREIRYYSSAKAIRARILSEKADMRLHSAGKSEILRFSQRLSALSGVSYTPQDFLAAGSAGSRFGAARRLSCENFGFLEKEDGFASRTGVEAGEKGCLTERKNFKDSENKENSCAAKAGVSEYGGASERSVLSRQSGARAECETEGKRNQSADAIFRHAEANFYHDDTNFSHLSADMDLLDSLILYSIRSLPAEALCEFRGVSEGIEHRLKAMAMKASSAEELIRLSVTRRYPPAHIRRILLAVLLGIRSLTPKPHPDYIRVLACNDTGIKILAQIKKRATSSEQGGNPPPEIIMKSSKSRFAMQRRGSLLFAIDQKADALYSSITKRGFDEHGQVPYMPNP